ncbi:MAG: glutaredoxin 3 [Chromatiaceae bacterium]
MSKVVMYTTMICPYCMRAKHLLQRKGVEYEEIRIDGDLEQMHVMMERTRRHTVPQIFIDDYHVGGFDDLATLEARGELDRLLGL